MKVVVSGCGKIGQKIVSTLVEEKHDIVVIDINPEVIESVTNIYDVMGIVGRGSDSEVLTEAGIAETDIFIATAESDELNMLSSFIAKKMGAHHTIARVRNPEYNADSLKTLRQNLDISMLINPERSAAQEIYNILKFPSAEKIELFSRSDFEMIELRLKPDSVLDGMSLYQMREKYKAMLLICAVQRGEEVFIPDGSFVLHSGDKIGITATPLEIQKFFKALNVYQKQAKNVMLLGGSKVAYYLTKMLTAAGSNVTILESNPATSKYLDEVLDKAQIMLSKGTHQEELLEAGLKEMDAFVSLTGMDETNMLVSVFAMSAEVPKVITKVARDELVPMGERLGLETMITPQNIISDTIRRYARALHNSEASSGMETLYHLLDGKVEAIEFRVFDEPSIVGIPLKELKLKKNILIAGIMRDRAPLIPTGNDCILPYDRVIIFCNGQQIHELTEILR